ncbi:MAG TPA: Hsp70 family protein [Amycolatopsis sp.]|uniref:Hsp70 family protein n=1 Tax=Amycolatopsis sp. TaxID=37632 RepID=UPI002B47CAF8|nr:Hsp70 family protein [Amycolatopsis sp.]HKS49833.1 Hsp70 family protein [Amycolatopsis sp.]
MTEVVGIDLGTTYSVVAHLGPGGNPEIIPDEIGGLLVPSVISFASDPPVVGALAKSAQADGETEVAATFKRHMGDRRFLLSFAGNDFDATDLSALVLAKLKAQAEAFIGEPVTQAVITVPAYFTHLQRTDTIAAGRRAGLDVLRVISEPTAAAIAYGLRAEPRERIALVYDLGGGTFDVSLVRIAGDEMRVLGTDGDHRLGGRDWDDRIVSHVHHRFATEFGVDIGPDDALTLLARAEQLKHTLSARGRGDILLDFAGKTARYQVSRETFEDLTRDLLDRTEQLTGGVVADAGLDWNQIDGVIPIGGSTRMPMVRERIARMSGRQPLSGVHPDQAVAIGAAIDAATEAHSALVRRIGAGDTTPKRYGLRLTQDVVAHSLGMIAENADRSRYVNSVLIRKNLPIPARESRPYQFRLHDTGENLLEIFLTQGETDDPKDCAYLGRYVVTGFGPGTGGTVVDIEYAYDHSGVVHVSATDRTTTRPLLVTIDAVPPDVPERFAGRPNNTSRRGHITVYLAFDLSGSMAGNPLTEAKRAAHAFVGQCDLSTTSIGLIGFSDRVKVWQTATQNAKDIGRAIDSLDACATGYGNRGHPFDELHDRLVDVPGARCAVVLADGRWARQEQVIPRATRCHAAGIESISIGFGSADQEFLRRIASSSGQSLFTELNRLTESFSTIARELTEGRGGHLSELTPRQA